jgi:hypothetical protein
MQDGHSSDCEELQRKDHLGWRHGIFVTSEIACQ